MEVLFLVAVLALNAVISWFNCRSVGRVWNESKALGGWLRVLAWCGAVQSAIGFSSVIGFMLGAVAYKFGYLSPAAAQGAVSLWYLLIIIPALSTGLLITIESWIIAFRERSLASLGGAAYNTLAMAHNAYGAIDGFGKAWDAVAKLFDGADDEEGGSISRLAIGLVLLALLGGVLLTAALIRRYAGTVPLHEVALVDHMGAKPGWNGR